MRNQDILSAEAQLRIAELSSIPLVVREPTANPFVAFKQTLSELVSRRYLLKLLVKREITARYKDSALGFVWATIKPLTQLMIYYLVIGSFLGAARSLENFGVFIFAGLTIYGLFADSVTLMTQSIVNNDGLIKKIYLPREIFPLSTLGSTLFNFGIQFVILLIASLVAGTITWGPQLLYIPFSTLLVLIWATGLGLMLSAWNVQLRDIGFMSEVILMLLMWFSPIVYSWTFVRDTLSGSQYAWAYDLYMASPITIAVLGYQEAFWATGSNGETPPHLVIKTVIATLVGLVFLFLGQRVFSKHQANFAQEL